MNKTSLALIVAGVLGVAGVAQAETFDSPVHQAGEASTMTLGQPNMATTNSPYTDDGRLVIHSATAPDLTVLGAGPVVTTDTYVTTHNYVLTPGYTLVSPPVAYSWSGATETSNVPLRAGEATTMTYGVPNAATNNY